MRSRIALVATLVVLGGLVLYATRPNAPPTAAVPTPTSTSVPTATTNATPTTSATPTPSPQANQDVVLTARPAGVPSDFKYIETWPGRIVMFDLAARRATEIATYTVPPRSEPGFPGAQLSASADGRTLLVLVLLSPADRTLFVLRPENGEVRLILRGPLDRAVLSADGSRFAVARHDPDARLTGISVGAIADGTTRRLIADDPQLVGSPPVPFAFSFDGQLLAFGLGDGPNGYQGGIIPVASSEVDAGRLRSARASTPGVTMLDAASGAEFTSTTELFIWSTRSALGGQTGAYTYDMASKKQVDLYRPSGDLQIGEAAWRPGSDQFATLEQPSCCGVSLPRTPWLRGRDGSAKKLLDATPFIGEMWWSRDGTKLYATTGGDDSTGGVIDLLTGQQVMGFCKRGGAAPGSCT